MGRRYGKLGQEDMHWLIDAIRARIAMKRQAGEPHRMEGLEEFLADLQRSVQREELLRARLDRAGRRLDVDS